MDKKYRMAYIQTNSRQFEIGAKMFIYENLESMTNLSKRVVKKLATISVDCGTLADKVAGGDDEKYRDAKFDYLRKEVPECHKNLMPILVWR